MLYRETGQFKTSYAADMAIFPIRQDRIALWVLLAFAFIGIPLLDAFQIWPMRGEYLIRAILIPFLILSLAAVGLNILTGYCGQLSLGSGAFMAIGAYSAYKFGTGVNIPLTLFTIDIPPLPVLPCILLGGLMAAIAGILFGIPSLRIKGLYLAVATLAAQFFFDWVFSRVKWFTNYTGSGSVTAPELNFFGFYANKPIEKYLVCLVFVAVLALVAKNLVRGNIGRQFHCFVTNEYFLTPIDLEGLSNSDRDHHLHRFGDGRHGVIQDHPGVAGHHAIPVTLTMAAGRTTANPSRASIRKWVMFR